MGVVRFGTGQALRIPSPFGVAVEPVVAVPGAGIMFPGKGRFVFGSTNCTGSPVKMFLTNNSLKLPWRISRVGTV